MKEHEDNRTGLDVLEEIRASTSKVPVLVSSGHPEEQYAVRVLKAGAAGYLCVTSWNESCPDCPRFCRPIPYTIFSKTPIS